MDNWMRLSRDKNWAQREGNSCVILSGDGVTPILVIPAYLSTSGLTEIQYLTPGQLEHLVVSGEQVLQEVG